MPVRPLISIVTEISPVLPGATAHGKDGNSAVVQPQDVLTAVIVTSLREMFVRINVKSAFVSSLLTVVTFDSVLKTMTPEGMCLNSGPVATSGRLLAPPLVAGKCTVFPETPVRERYSRFQITTPTMLITTK
jgi:hypothetical protein